MELPKTPPQTSDLLDQFPVERAREVLAHRQAVVDGEYLHWDDLRFRDPPKRLTIEECWLVIKLRRRAQARELPLLGVDGEAFWYCLIDPILEAVHRIDQQMVLAVGAPPPIIDPASRDRYLVNALIEEAITSSLIEGAATTRRVAKEMIRSARAPRDPSERMVLNNFHAIRRIRELASEPLTAKIVCELHRILTDGTLEDASSAGRLRHRDEPIVVAGRYGDTLYEPPPADELPVRLEAMCRFANGETPDQFVPPALRAIALHFWLAFDHPFVDGNGRTARALFYWAMLRHGFALFEFVSLSSVIYDARESYYRSFLLVETDEYDLTYFLIHQLKMIDRAIQQLHDYVQRKEQELLALGRKISEVALNYRQQALLAHAAKHPEGEITIRSHQQSHRVAYQTARTDLLELHEMGLLEKSTAGKAFRFRPARQLAERLAAI